MKYRRWPTGSTVLYRYGRRGRARFVNVGTVVDDSAEGLALWIAPGSPMIRSVPEDGGDLRDVQIDKRFGVPVVQEHGHWRGPGILRFVPARREWSVSWFFHDDGSFRGWYGNLEAPQVRWETPGSLYGVDTADRVLDVMIFPDRTVEWKDEDELATVVDQGLFTPAHAERIRGHGRALADIARQGLPPFDGRWTNFEPDPSWQTPCLPPEWNAPHRYTADL
ncbi:DUF402 domain-containing protein [Streptosporangium sp. KLBMP 9127]|nr:DUF402 domain-containing protein [Streptosporangium sp. KLBMP 9127]